MTATRTECPWCHSSAVCSPNGACVCSSCGKVWLETATTGRDRAS